MALLPQVVPVPHSYFAPLPSPPPVAVKMVELPEQIDAIPLMPVGAVGSVQEMVTITTTEAQEVVVLLQGELPVRRTQ